MSIFKDIINAWKSDDLLSQAWEESLYMLMLSHKIFLKSIKYLNSGEDIESVKDLKKRDITINDYHKSVRRKLVTHFSMGENSKHIASGFILAEMAVDIERIGDYIMNNIIGHFSNKGFIAFYNIRSDFFILIIYSINSFFKSC